MLLLLKKKEWTLLQRADIPTPPHPTPPPLVGEYEPRAYYTSSSRRRKKEEEEEEGNMYMRMLNATPAVHAPPPSIPPPPTHQRPAALKTSRGACWAWCRWCSSGSRSTNRSRPAWPCRTPCRCPSHRRGRWRPRRLCRGRSSRWRLGGARQLFGGKVESRGGKKGRGG